MTVNNSSDPHTTEEQVMHLMQSVLNELEVGYEVRSIRRSHLNNQIIIVLEPIVAR